VSLVPNYPTTLSFSTSHHPPQCVMSIPGSWTIGDNPHEVTTAVLNADIETLIAFKDTVESIPVKAVFESVIGILSLVRVRLLTPFPLSRPLIGDATRTG